MEITINGNVTINFDSIYTYGELRSILPSTGTSRVPGINQLRQRAKVIHRSETGSGVIEIYDNGFFTYKEVGAPTVYGVDRCERPETYTYSGKKEAGQQVPDLSPYPWDLILEAAGSARLSHNQENREESHMEYSLDAPESENNLAFSVRPEHEIREEEEEMAAWREARVSKMHEAMERPTARQREIAMRYFKDKKNEKEIAAEIGKSQQYVSKTIKRYLEIVNEIF